MAVELHPITKDNVGDVFDLKVAPGQEEYVSTNAWPLAPAFAEYDIAWPQAIVHDGEVVGFLMLEIDPEEENGHPYWLWRLMVDAVHQRRGFGTAALALAIEHLRSLGATELMTSWVPGERGPGDLYLRHGFVPTGELDDDEIVARLDLRSS